ncbi:Retrotransposon-derived protein peg10 [Ceratobasidium sp. 414]|nr:Retrotransposon-derived protein peg10 [Ceratobasidium sp. 414]
MATNKQEANQSFQQLNQAIIDLCALLTQQQGMQGRQQGTQTGGQQSIQGGQQTTSSSRSLKINKPEKFDGSDLDKTSEFVVASQLYLCDGAAGATAEQKITFVISLLTGSARMWVQPFLEQDLQAGMNQALQVPWLHDEAAFWTEFNSRYADVNRKDTYREKLLKLHQTTGSVQEYLTKFYAYLNLLGYGDTELCDRFYHGLHDKVKKLFSYQNFKHTSATFVQLVQHALTVDKHLLSINTYRNTSHASTSKATASQPQKTAQAAGTPGPSYERFNANDAVFMRGADRKIVRGTIKSIGRNTGGKAVPNVQWEGTTNTVQIPFKDLQKNTRVSSAPPAAGPVMVTPLKDNKGPAPMDLDSAGKGKSFEAVVVEESDSDDEATLKGNT